MEIGIDPPFQIADPRRVYLQHRQHRAYRLRISKLTLDREPSGSRGQGAGPRQMDSERTLSVGFRVSEGCGQFLGGVAN